MNPDLEKLVRLHRVDSELKLVESELAAVPRLRQQIDDRLARDRSHLEAAKAALEGSQKARKQNEASVQDLETKRSKYKGQLMEVKTNREYTAVLHEIEGVERDIKAREDVILGEMEKAEALALDVKREEAASRRSRPTRRRRRRTSTPARRRWRPRRSGSRRSATRWPPPCPRSSSPSTGASPSSGARGSPRRGTACASPATCGCGYRSGWKCARTTRSSSASPAAAWSSTSRPRRPSPTFRERCLAPPRGRGQPGQPR
jgi:hypothetical protein